MGNLRQLSEILLPWVIVEKNYAETSQIEGQQN
jgi:hypothetical protein